MIPQNREHFTWRTGKDLTGLLRDGRLFMKLRPHEYQGIHYYWLDDFNKVVFLICPWCEPHWRDHLTKDWLTWEPDDSDDFMSGPMSDSEDSSDSAEYVGPAPEAITTSASSNSVQRAIQDGHPFN